MPSRRVVVLLVTLCMIPWIVSCSHKLDPPAVLLISIDTLRPDHLGLYGYARSTSPKIDHWFSNAAVFERSYSTEANTSPSMISVLTGQLPQEHGVRMLLQLLPSRTPLLTDMLPSKYQTAGIVANTVLTDEAIGIANRFDYYDDYLDDIEPYRDIYERNARRTTDAALHWLKNEYNPQEPSFLWIHYIDPHGPYHPPNEWEPSFNHDAPVVFGLQKMPSYQREPGVNDGLTYVDRYDEEIAYLDSQIGRLMEGYAKMINIDEALVILTADHGESMMEHEKWFTHGYHVYEEIVRVPLLIRGPGVTTGKVPGVTSGIDIAPTILRFVDIEPHDFMKGLDLREVRRIPTERVVFTEGTWEEHQWRAAIQTDRKWMLRIKRGERTVTKRRFYDLTTDPNELHPMAWETQSDASSRLLDLYLIDPDPGGLPAQYVKGFNIKAPKVAPHASDEAMKRLRSLGYVQ